MAKVNVTEVDRDLFAVARFVAQAMNFRAHNLFSIHMDGIWMDFSDFASAK